MDMQEKLDHYAAFHFLSDAFVNLGFEDEDARKILADLALEHLKASSAGKKERTHQYVWRVQRTPVDERIETWWIPYKEIA